MPSRNAATARQVWWASVPVWSIGFLSPVPFLIYAIIHRTRRDWAVFAGYLAARDKLGRFVSAEELCEYTQLSPDRVDGLRDLMIFT
jgi:hypothetical protein